MNTERFRVRHAIVDAVRYDGSEQSIRRIMEMLGPEAQVKGPATIGDTLFIDGNPVKPSDVVARGTNRKYCILEEHVFEAIYERESGDPTFGSMSGAVVAI
jgi:hypothetical protein